MDTITTKDGTKIFFKDWGERNAQTLVFHHGWPLSADDWDNQLMFFLGQGFRVVAHDRRGRGRSTQTDTGKVKKDSNPGGTPIEAFDGYRAAVAANRSQAYLDIASGPFYGFNRPGVTPIEGVIRNWWRQSMMGGIKAQYECIKVFSETDLTEDLKAIEVPVLLLHSEDDQIVPYEASAPLAVKLLKHGVLKTYPDRPHGMPTTHADSVNAEILSFIRG